MNASSLPQTIVARACCAALIGAVFGASCGSKTPSRDGTTTTIATTTVATTTSTVPPTTTTSSTTTIGVGVLDARIDIQNPPCVAPGSGAVSCTFTGASTTGGRTPYTFSWRFTNFANNQVITGTGQTERPELGCGFLAGVATFNVRAALTVRDASNTSNTDTRDIQVARAAGACGT